MLNRIMSSTAMAFAGMFAAVPANSHESQQRATTGEASTGWQQLTRVDVEAAYELLAKNHPASAPANHDPVFIAALTTAHQKALRRALSVNNMDGYTAVLREFANALGDGHIAANPVFDRDTIEWAGIIAAKRGTDWVVARADPQITGITLDGSRIIDCDGRPVADLAKQVMAFRSIAGAEAIETMRAGRLLLDDGNPFLSRPTMCRFDKDGVPVAIKFRWQQAGRSELQKTYWKPVPGHAGFGVRRVGQAYWIGFGALEPAAQATIDQVAAQAAAIRNATYVVVDLRGNGGGNDAYGRKLADALYGHDYVDAVLGPAASNCPSVFRASAENIAAVRDAITAFKASGDKVGETEYSHALRAMQIALGRGEALTGPVSCPASPRSSADKASSLVQAPVVVLTDVACFSSCINVVGAFRRLGAIQVGQITGEDTHYSEVRQITLPSGLATFSTMMAIMPDAPSKIGPYRPSVSYDGDISDTAKLEAWLPTTLSSPRT